MKIIEHATIPWPQELPLHVNPLVVFVGRKLELHIRDGDTVEMVAKIIQREWHYDFEESCRIAGFWFAVGERRAKRALGGWTEAEVDPTPTRAYNPTDTAGRTVRRRKLHPTGMLATAEAGVAERPR